MRYKCDNCGAKKYWKLAGGEYRCKVCRNDAKPKFIPGFNLSKKDWIEIIDLFLLEVNSPTIKEKTERSMGTINKVLRLLRMVMLKDIPRMFSGTVEVDETYLGGQKKNKNKNQFKKGKGNIWKGKQKWFWNHQTACLWHFVQERKGVC